MSKPKQIPRTVLERTMKEQEQTILQLRSQNSELMAKLAAQRKRGRKKPTKRPSDIGRDGCYKRGTAGHLRGVRAAMGLLGG